MLDMKKACACLYHATHLGYVLHFAYRMFTSLKRTLDLAMDYCTRGDRPIVFFVKISLSQVKTEIELRSKTENEEHTVYVENPDFREKPRE